MLRLRFLVLTKNSADFGDKNARIEKLHENRLFTSIEFWWSFLNLPPDNNKNNCNNTVNMCKPP